MKTRTFTKTERQFWRESEQRWVDHVSIRRDEIADYGGTAPERWRHRVITTVVVTDDWQEGKS